MSLVIRPLAEGSHPDPLPLSVPLSWAVSLSSPPAPSGPSWLTRSLLSLFRLSSHWTAHERKRNWTCMLRRIFIIFIFLPQPFPPFLYSLTAPRPFSKQSQQAVSTDQHQSHSQPPQNPVSKVFSRIIWGGSFRRSQEAPMGKPWHEAPSAAPPPRPVFRGLAAHEKLLSASTLATPAAPARTGSLPASPALGPGFSHEQLPLQVPRSRFCCPGPGGGPERTSWVCRTHFWDFSSSRAFGWTRV